MGRLKALAGVAPARNSLTSLLAELRIVNANPHDALSDAFATAQATIELLARAATAGHGPLAALLRTVEATTALTQAAGTFAGEPAKRTTSPGLSAVHLRSHSRVLGPTPAPRTLSTWTTSLVECARLRCSHAGDRIATAGPAADVLAVELTTALRTLHAAGDAPGTATVLHAASGLLEAIGDTRTGRHRRRAALTLYDTWTPLVDGITRCGEGHACPACREGRPCGVDTWTYHLAGAAVGAWTLNAVKSFMPVSGAKVRSQESVWGSWTRDGCGSLADAALWRCHEWWTEQGQPGSAASLAQISWEWGARHPRVALAYADAVAAGGRHEDLRVALDITAQTLDHPRKDGPPEHWRTLAARRTLLSAQLARGTARPTGQVDEDGSPIMARRHHPEEPRRSRPSRFLRTSG